MNRSRQNRGPVDPSSEQEIFARFQETLGMLIGFTGPPGQTGRSDRETLFGGQSRLGTTGPTGATQTRVFASPGHGTFSITTSTTYPGSGMQGGDHMHMERDHTHNHPDDFDMYEIPLHHRTLLRPMGV